MSITLDGIELPSELIWVDEFDWTAVEASVEATISSKLIVTESLTTEQQGRPVTLSSDYAWAIRTSIASVWDKFQQIGLAMTLVLNDDSSYQVRFRHWDKPAFSAANIVNTAFPDDNTYYNMSLKLVIVG